MIGRALFVRIEAKEGKEDEVEVAANVPNVRTGHGSLHSPCQPFDAGCGALHPRLRRSPDEIPAFSLRLKFILRAAAGGVEGLG